MVTIEQAINDLNKSELRQHNEKGVLIPEEDSTICTTAGELIILLEELQRYRDAEMEVTAATETENLRCRNCLRWHPNDELKEYEKGKCEIKPEGKLIRANNKACKKFINRITKFE